MLEIKRNIFESSARMPKQYEPVATPMVQQDAPMTHPMLPGCEYTENSVKHARSPRIGEQK